jgi:transcription termination factor NusB
MDTIDKALFLLGYAEFKVLWTPKEIIINELVELAKRYADDGAAKLVNAIMHKVLG